MYSLTKKRPRPRVLSCGATHRRRASLISRRFNQTALPKLPNRAVWKRTDELATTLAWRRIVLNQEMPGRSLGREVDVCDDIKIQDFFYYGFPSQ